MNLYVAPKDVKKLEKIAKSQSRSKSRQVTHWINEEWKRLFGEDKSPAASFNQPEFQLTGIAA